MTPGEPGHREPKPPDRTVFCERAERVLATGRREPAARAEQRTDEPPVSDDGQHQETSRHRAWGHGSVRLPVICHAGAPSSTLPNLPPQQPFHHQVQISGQIRLACTRGHGVRAQHKKATARK